MKHMPLGANVNTLDAVIGKSEDVVINPVTREITYLVVKEKSFPHLQRLVPIAEVRETSSSTIQLNIDAETFATLEPFEITHFVTDDLDFGPEDAYILEPYATPVQAEIVEERVPPGQLAMRRGTAVMATDGKVGEIDEFYIEPKDGHITHIVLHERHMLSTQTLALPLSALDKVEDGVVYLKLSKEQVKALPAVPKHRRGWEEAEVELIVLIFEETDQAKEALDDLKSWRQRKVIGSVRNAAVIVKNQDGKASIHESGDMSGGRGAVFGAITGGLIGLVGGPVGAVVGAAAGAATGGVAAGRIDVGLPNEYLAKIKADMEPGTSALVAIVEHEWTTSIMEGMGAFKGQVYRQALTDDIVAQLISDDAPEDGDA